MKNLLNEKGEPFAKVLEYDGYYFLNYLGGQPDVDVSKFLSGLNELTFNDGEKSVASYPKSVLNGGWIQWIEEWKKFQKENPDYPLLEISYEEMKRNLKETVQMMSKFLDLDSPPELIEEIARKCDFEIMSTHKNANLPQEMSKITNKENSHIFYRKGEVGDWKNYFTVAENEAFDKPFEPQLAELGLNIKYEL